MSDKRKGLVAELQELAAMVATREAKDSDIWGRLVDMVAIAKHDMSAVRHVCVMAEAWFDEFENLEALAEGGAESLAVVRAMLGEESE